MLLTGTFTGCDDIESYITRYELFVTKQNRHRTVTREENPEQKQMLGNKISQQKFGNRVLSNMEQQNESKEKLEHVFQALDTEKLVVLQGHLARSAQCP